MDYANGNKACWDHGKQQQAADEVFKKFTHLVFLCLMVVGAEAPLLDQAATPFLANHLMIAASEQSESKHSRLAKAMRS